MCVCVCACVFVCVCVCVCMYRYIHKCIYMNIKFFVTYINLIPLKTCIKMW